MPTRPAAARPRFPGCDSRQPQIRHQKPSPTVGRGAHIVPSLHMVPLLGGQAVGGGCREGHAPNTMEHGDNIRWQHSHGRGHSHGTIKHVGEKRGLRQLAGLCGGGGGGVTMGGGPEHLLLLVVFGSHVTQITCSQ